jgi:hypothetical protein
MTLDDIPFASMLYDRDAARSLVACPRPESLWRYLLQYTAGTSALWTCRDSSGTLRPRWKTAWRVRRLPVTAAKISEYRHGCKLVFENGKLTNAQVWLPTVEDGGDCGFPPLVFLQLLFCRRSLAELRESFNDVRAKDEAALLLDALFPKQRSLVIPVG